MSKRKVIALVGLSGVGKSTFLKDALSRGLVFEHLQASKLIELEHREKLVESVAHDLLRENSIDTNQSLLVGGFIKRAPKEGLIVLDGHVVIDTPDGLVNISPAVFSMIGVCRFVVLVDEPENIVVRRLSDTKRSRPVRSSEELSTHQERSILAAYRAALALSVPLVVVPVGAGLDIAAFLAP